MVGEQVDQAAQVDLEGVSGLGVRHLVKSFGEVSARPHRAAERGERGREKKREREPGAARGRAGRGG
ncbi:hypothetical protein GCM10010388_76810 [Streptomyces mauvecolor]